MEILVLPAVGYFDLRGEPPPSFLVCRTCLIKLSVPTQGDEIS